VTQLIMMKVDVLTIFDTIKVCTHYEMPDGFVTEKIPYDLCDGEVTPVYKEFGGWKQNLDGLREYDEIPSQLAEYVEFLERELAIPITFISTGPDREALIQRTAVNIAG
jgi:adenylosuccinate synthase